jgi:hypothetical protein
MSNNAVEVANKLGAVVSPLQVLNTMLEVGDKWVNEVQKAKSQRAEIDAWKDSQIERIHAQRDVLLKALDLTFDERRENFGRLFNGLDAAMQSNDATLAASILESITELAKESPFKELANVEIIVTELKRPGQVWEV